MRQIMLCPVISYLDFEVKALQSGIPNVVRVQRSYCFPSLLAFSLSSIVRVRNDWKRVEMASFCYVASAVY